MLENNAITLYVKDVKKSSGFYSKLLGREVFKLSPHLVIFVQETGSRIILKSHEIVDPKCELVGGMELAFGVFDDAEVDATHLKWIDQGIAISVAPARNAYSYSFLALDPDGHRLRVYAYHGFSSL